MSKTVTFQTIQINISNSLNFKNQLFQTIQLSINTQFQGQNSSISHSSVEHKYTV